MSSTSSSSSSPGSPRDREVIERKVAELWNVIRPDARAVAIAIASLQVQGKDTTTPSITTFLRGAASGLSVPPLMAHVKRNVDWIDQGSPRDPPMLVETIRSGGLVQHRFAPGACAAIRRRDSSQRAVMKFRRDRLPFAESLTPGETYSWADLARGFGFAIGYLNRAGRCRRSLRTTP